MSGAAWRATRLAGSFLQGGGVRGLLADCESSNPGLLRRAAYRIPEHHPGRWALLMAGDR